MPIPLKFKAALDDSAFMAGIRRIKTASSKLGGRVSAGGAALGRGAAGLAGGIGAAAGVRSIANQADQLYNLSRKTGMTTTSLAALAEMGKGANVEMEQLAASVVKMQQAFETKAGQEAIASLGLSIEKLRELKPEEQFATIGDSISKLSDQARKADLAKGIFGRGGSDMFELFDDIGKLDMNKVSANAARMGESAKSIADAMDKLQGFGVGVMGRGAVMMKQALEGDAAGFFGRTKPAGSAATGGGGKGSVGRSHPFAGFQTANQNYSKSLAGLGAFPEAGPKLKNQLRSEIRGGLTTGGLTTGGLSTGSLGSVHSYTKRGDAKTAKQAEANNKALGLQEGASNDLKAIRETLEGWDQ